MQCACASALYTTNETSTEHHPHPPKVVQWEWTNLKKKNSKKYLEFLVFHTICIAGELDAVKSALENGADIEARDNNTLAAKWAALDSEILKNGNWNFDTCGKKTNWLIDRISWTDSEDHGYLGWTALHHSSEHGDLLLNLFIFFKSIQSNNLFDWKIEMQDTWKSRNIF